MQRGFYDPARRKLREQLKSEYGTIADDKKSLVTSLQDIQFDAAAQLFREFETKQRVLEEQMAANENWGINDLYRDYIEFYTKGKILISNHLNKINIYKKRIKPLSQQDVAVAQTYFYGDNIPQEPVLQPINKKLLLIQAKGIKGELDVDYALKWLDKKYIVITKGSTNKYGMKRIIIANPEFMDESQEFDHLIVGEQGIFMVETKNYAGKLIVDKNGNWIRVASDGSEEGERNPIQQVGRHEKMLRSFIPPQVKIISIICMANPKMIIEGVENCVIPIIKSDMLEYYIEHYETKTKLRKKDIDKCVELIEAHMCMPKPEEEERPLELPPVIEKQESQPEHKQPKPRIKTVSHKRTTKKVATDTTTTKVKASPISKDKSNAEEAKAPRIAQRRNVTKAVPHKPPVKKIQGERIVTRRPSVRKTSVKAISVAAKSPVEATPATQVTTAKMPAVKRQQSATKPTTKRTYTRRGVSRNNKP